MPQLKLDAFQIPEPTLDTSKFELDTSKFSPAPSGSSQPGFLSRLYDQGKGLLEFGKSMGDWPSAMTQGAQTGYNLANDTWNYLKNPQTAIDALKFERNPMSKEAMQIGLKNPGTKFGLGTIGADANAIGEDLGNNNYSGLAADIGGPAVLGIAAHKLGGFTPGEKLPEVLPAEFKSQRLLNGKVPLPDVEVPAREVAQLSAGPDAPLQLPALGETTNNQAPRFYAGDLGLVDANRRYPIDLTDKSKVGLRASEFDFPEQAPPELNLQNGDILPTSRTIQTAGLDSPTMLPGDIDASLGERNPIDVAAQGNRAPLKAYDPTDIFGWHGTPLDPRRSANIPVSLSMPETPAPTLEQPLGGRIVNPPTPDLQLLTPNELLGNKGDIKVLDPNTPLYHGTDEANRKSILSSKSFNPNEGIQESPESGIYNLRRQYDYSMAGPDATYLTDKKNTWLDPEWAEQSLAVSYPDYVETRLKSNARIARIDSREQLDLLAQKAGFKDAHAFQEALDIDGLQSGNSTEAYTKSRLAVQQFKDKTGYDGFHINFEDKTPWGDDSVPYETKQQMSNPFGGEQTIVFDSSKVKPFGSNELIPNRSLRPDQSLFRTNTLVGDEASAFREPVTTPKEFPKMFDPNARIETKGNTLNLSPEQTKQLAAAPDITPLGPVDKLKAALDQSGPLNKQQRLIYAQERAKRLAALDAQPITNQAEYKAQRAKLAGEYQKVQNEPLKLDQADIDNLYKMIAEHPAAIGFNKVHAGDALAKMLSGGVPTNSEIGILRKIFGGDLPTPKMTAFQKGSTAVGRVRNIVKTMMTGEDLSWPLRQGLPMISRPEWWKAQKNNMAFFSKEYAKGAQAAIESKPTFPLQQESGLRLSDPETGSAGEGYFVDKLVNMIPGMPGSKRAYAAVSNKVKSDVWDTLYKGLEAGGYDPANNPLLQKQISSYVNNATGSGGLGALEKHADLLNKIFFAPRKIAADLKLLNPVTYVAQENPMIRQAYLRSLFGIAAAGTTALGLGKLGGADVETDPHSADFGKVKFGNTRFDPWGGKQQYIVAAARLLPDMLGGGEMKSSTTGKEYQLGSRYGLPTRFDVGVNFLNSKADPLVSFATTLLRGKDMNGNPVEVAPEIAARFTPMVMQDTYQMFQNNPELLPVGIPAAIFGMGAQSYGKPTPYGNFRQ